MAYATLYQGTQVGNQLAILTMAVYRLYRMSSWLLHQWRL
jgi:hypothetical protein